MSKRAEEAALKAYPIKDYNKEPNYVHTCDTKMLDKVYREVFKLGYMQAEKDTLERVILWLKDNADKYIVDIGVGYGENGRNVELIVGGKCWVDLKKAMEDEQ